MVVAYRSLMAVGTSTAYMLALVASSGAEGEPVDFVLRDSDDASNDPDIVTGAEQVTVPSFTDQYQATRDKGSRSLQRFFMIESERPVG